MLIMWLSGGVSWQELVKNIKDYEMWESDKEKEIRKHADMIQIMEAIYMGRYRWLRYRWLRYRCGYRRERYNAGSIEL